MSASPKRQGVDRPHSVESTENQQSGTRRALGPRGDDAVWATLVGPTWDLALEKQPPLPIRLRVLFDVVLALEALHEDERLASDEACHGHVSPEDIVVGANGIASITNVVRDYRRNKLPKQPRRGYLAPELLLRKYPASRKTDVFSLGVLLWEALTERRLFPENKAQELFRQIRSHELPEPGDLPGEAWALVMVAEKAFTYHPKNRYSSAKELLADMQQSAGGLLASHADVSHWVQSNWRIQGEYVAPPTLSASASPLHSGPAPSGAAASGAARTSSISSASFRVPGPPKIPSLKAPSHLKHLGRRSSYQPDVATGGEDFSSAPHGQASHQPPPHVSNNPTPVIEGPPVSMPSLAANAVAANLAANPKTTDPTAVNPTAVTIPDMQQVMVGSNRPANSQALSQPSTPLISQRPTPVITAEAAPTETNAGQTEARADLSTIAETRLTPVFPMAARDQEKTISLGAQSKPSLRPNSSSGSNSAPMFNAPKHVDQPEISISQSPSRRRTIPAAERRTTQAIAILQLAALTLLAAAASGASVWWFLTR